MMYFAIHFVKHLPSDQGKDKNPVILLLGGNVSRWNAALSLYFMNNNDFLFILALHSSVWSQSNNNRPNLRIHKCVEKEVSKLGMKYTGEKVKHSYFNKIIRHTWKEFITINHKELFTCKINMTSSTYCYCGIYPFDQNCDG